MIQKIVHHGRLLSIIIKANFKKEGIEFFTPNDFSQQLAYMNRPKGYIIAPHVHNAVVREVQFTKEVLVVKQGKLRIDFYDEDKNYLESRIIETGDVILLAYGGHGIEMLEDSEIVEIKQGPYAGEMDKVRFEPIGKSKLQIEGES
ncbi:MAG: hypothetical protein DCC43_04795 [Candidatus Brocadia sp.]|jgi:hypothetical protein|nr:hypothetical protein [Candidatus Brocadia fulgida]MCC6326699.1 hypothetical protein [Candidatus Brocadia sp.]MCE7911314.1 hypothetical protein [Candidatus Brocadia sp. AMX3]OQY98983.1 MAG: hypothetical protein B6D35_10675 [Candidatus Brocadia sp. UTAMX2]MDG5996235.1 hypothetical protein [Candidatus Brocadia sp.]